MPRVVKRSASQAVKAGPSRRSPGASSRNRVVTGPGKRHKKTLGVATRGNRAIAFAHCGGVYVVLEVVRTGYFRHNLSPG
jgi:hypothetical protein